MIDLGTVTDFMKIYFLDVRISKIGTHFNARCVLCRDGIGKRRFNLSWNNGSPVYRCFHCGRIGSFFGLMREFRLN